MTTHITLYPQLPQIGPTALGIAYGEYLRHVRELGTSNSGKEVDEYLASAGLGAGYAWCAAFGYWCLRNAAAALAIPFIMQHHLQYPARVQSWAEAAMDSGAIIPSSAVRPGDIALFAFGDDPGHHDHLGIIQARVIITPDMIEVNTVDGNTSFPDDTVVSHQREGVAVQPKCRHLSGSRVAFVSTKLLVSASLGG